MLYWAFTILMFVNAGTGLFLFINGQDAAAAYAVGWAILNQLWANEFKD